MLTCSRILPLQWLAGAALATIPPMATENEADFAPLETYVAKTMQRLAPSSAAIVVSQGEEIIFERYLTGSFEGLPETPINADSLFAMASVTKSFTAGALMTLVDQGVVDLDAPVSDHLPYMAAPGAGPFSRASVTLRHLASHSSGLQFPHETRTGDPQTIAAITAPGEEFRYSETGMKMLQETIEEATGLPWPQLLHTHVLAPLGLNATRYVATPDPNAPLVPARAGDFADPAQHYFFTATNSLTGSGLYSTARDLNRYGQLWAQQGRLGDKRLFSSALAQEATRSQAVFDYNGAHYGLLWWVFPPRQAIVMSGATHTVSAIVPEIQVVVTVVRNYFGEIPEGFIFHEDKMKLVDLAIALAPKP
jgi:CubicO group peptidase (beta-lactamase class C family)